MLARLGARVRALRLGADLTVGEFAERASLSPRFINQLEAGTGNISVARLAQVAATLGRTLPDGAGGGDVGAHAAGIAAPARDRSQFARRGLAFAG